MEKEALAIIHALKKFHKFLYGRKFIICTDNKPIVSLLSELKGIPILARQRLQRWAVIMSAYNYELQYRKAKQLYVTDFLSRHPLQQQDKNDKYVNLLFALNQEILDLNIESIAAETNSDLVLKCVMQHTLNGWSESCMDDKLKPFWLKRDEISIEQQCLMWGDRVIIPSKLQNFVLNLLHENHPGECRMKLLARSICWWPNIDVQISNYVKACKICQQTQNNEPQQHQSWPHANRRMQRVHIDFAQFKNKYYLIIIDSYSRWLDVKLVDSTEFASTKHALLEFFAEHGLCETLVTDGGPPFNSQNFTYFCKKRQINHLKSPPHHPCANGLAEKGVQIFKKFIKKIYLEHGNNISATFVKNKIVNFLFSYRNTPSVTNNKSPAELFLKCKPKTELTNLNPKLNLHVHKPNPNKPKKSFNNGEKVYCKTVNNNIKKWEEGKVVDKISPFVYKINVNGRERSYHIDQIKNMYSEGIKVDAPMQNNIVVDPNSPRDAFPSPANRTLPTSIHTPMVIHNSPSNQAPPPPLPPQNLRRSSRQKLVPKRLMYQ